MGIGAVPATQQKALERAGISLDDVGLVELNEAFAAQSLAVMYEWGMNPEDERSNPNGGVNSLEHPLGCSGARILTTLVHAMKRRDEVQYGQATMCIGVGQASRCSSRRSKTLLHIERRTRGTATEGRDRWLPA